MDRRSFRALSLALLLAGCGGEGEDGVVAASPTPDAGGVPDAAPAPPANTANGSVVSVTILEPPNSALLASTTVHVRARLTSARALASANLVVDGVRTPIDLATRSAEGEVVLDKTLAEGDHQIEIVATDDAGGTDSAKVGVGLDVTGPELTLLAPLRLLDAETRRLLRGTVRDARGIASVSYAVNGAEPVTVTPAPNTKELRLAEVLPLQPGPNSVTLSLTDSLGNERMETVDFRYGLVTTGGGAHSGAVIGDRLYVWGRNNVGQLGLGEPIGDANSKLSPALQPTFGDPAKPIAAAAFNQNHSLAIALDGTVWMWGANGAGQLGQADKTNRPTPQQVPGVTAVYGALGYTHSLVLHADGSVSAWGDNTDGQLGDGSTETSRMSPVTVTGLPANIVKIIGGSSHSVALTANGDVWMWGSNGYGQHGIGAADDDRHPTPAKVAALADIVDIANGRDHLLALKADGTVVSCGLGSSGQLGYGENALLDEDRTAPVDVMKDAATKLSGVVAVFANGNSSYALLANKQYWGWGQNFSGQLALGATSSEEWFPVRAAVYTTGAAPVYFDQAFDMRAIGSGTTHTIVRTKAGETYAWGWNFRGSLGVPTLANAWAQTTPVLVTMP